MFETKDKLIDQLRSPLNISMMVLDEIQDRLGGNRIIADVNSPFCHLLEFGSSINAATITAVDEKFPQLYAARAESMDDLYHHMSDFDYLAMYSNPSQTTITLAFPKKYFIDNALNYNENYKKVTIPKDTVFLIGRYYFGLYYPIDILINSYTHTFTVLYDTSVDNPLHALTQNVINKIDTTYGSLDYLVIDFPIYQFAKSTVEDSTVAETGYVKRIVYNNNFYACRIFYFKDGEYHEMHQVQSRIIYDATEPTAFIRLYPDEQTLKIHVPQIYFDKGMMGSKILIEMYTTMGSLDIDTTNIAGSSIQANFALKSRETTEYSAILKNLPFDLVMKLSSTKISGGSTAIDVDTLRNRVVNDLLYEKVPITENDMMAYLGDKGFYLKKYLDNVTDRVYHAYRVLEDGNGGIIPSSTLKMRMLGSYADTYATFLLQSDQSITVLPTTIYKYIEEADDVVPLSNEELRKISEMDKIELAHTLNNSQYMRTPFHVRFDLSDSWPKAVSYNLLTPEVTSVIFEGENFNITARMMTFEASIRHLNDGVGGYEVLMSVYKSDDLANIAPNDLLVYVTVKTTDNYWVGLQATYIRSTDTRDIYGFQIATNYHIDARDHLGITNFQSENFSLAEHSVELEQNWNVVFMVRKSAFPLNYDEAEQKISLGVPSSYMGEFVAMDRQYLTLHLGHNLSRVIKNDIEISTTSRVYATWDHNVPRTYTQDVYARDENGNMIVEFDAEGYPVIKKEHVIGEEMLDEAGQVIYQHKIGDVRYGSNGQPILAVDRNKVFYTDLMFIDAKVFASEKPTELEFASNMPSLLESYFSVISNLQENLLERTYMYFRCVKSTGTAKFNLGDGNISKQNLEMSFAINCYVPSYVKSNDRIQQEIISMTCDAIESAIKTKTISMMDIFEYVKNKLSDYIDHFSLLGINGSVTNQTFVIMDEDAQPSIRHELVVTEDNILQLRKSIQMNFVALEDNVSSVDEYAV